MTGEILQRLREGYGFSQRAVAGLMVDRCAVSSLEVRGRSWGERSGRPCRKQRQHDRFRDYLNALRILCGKQPKRTPAATKKTETNKGATVDKAPYKPAGATHRIELRGIKEWARIVPMHGTLRGFEWRGGEWRRAAWVEGSNEFQAALLAARLPQRKHKVRAVAGGVDEYHHAMREWVY
nr:MAG TPA: hypothetical protein [Caudoviricetes sp.]